MMKNKKKIVPVAHKRVISTIEKYKERVQRDKDLYNEEVENFIINVSPYITKKGIVRKNLSKKKIEDFNKLVTNIKTSGIDTLTGIRRENKRLKIEKSNKKREQKFLDKWVGTKEEAENVTSLLENKLVQKLMNKGYIDIYNLMDIAEDDDINEVDTMSVVDYTIKELESVTPDEIFDELEEDDDIQLFKEYQNNKSKTFMTRQMFYKWLQENFEKVRRKKAFKVITSVSMLSDNQLEEQYREFLEGNYNRYL